MAPEQDPAGFSSYQPDVLAPDWDINSLFANVYDRGFPTYNGTAFPQPVFRPAEPFPPPTVENLPIFSLGMAPPSGPPTMITERNAYPTLSTIPGVPPINPRTVAVPANTVARNRDPRRRRVNREGPALIGATRVPIPVITISLPTPSFPLVRNFPANWIRIPQRNYGHGSKQLGFERLEPTIFDSKDYPGVNLGDALRKNYASLRRRDDPMVQTTSGVASCRLLFPGYPDNGKSCQINMLNWTRTRVPIPRSKLAHEVARQVDRYLTRMASITPDGSVEEFWTIGRGFMQIDNMYLVSLVSVSTGSFQPEIWVAIPSMPRVRASGGRN